MPAEWETFVSAHLRAVHQLPHVAALSPAVGPAQRAALGDSVHELPDHLSVQRAVARSADLAPNLQGPDQQALCGSNVLAHL